MTKVMTVVTLQLTTGPTTILAESVAPGLAVHRPVAHIPTTRKMPNWQITHTPSGKALSFCKTKTEALGLAHRYAALADWMQPGETLAASPSLRSDMARVRAT